MAHGVIKVSKMRAGLLKGPSAHRFVKRCIPGGTRKEVPQHIVSGIQGMSDFRQPRRQQPHTIVAAPEQLSKRLKVISLVASCVQINVSLYRCGKRLGQLSVTGVHLELLTRDCRHGCLETYRVTKPGICCRPISQGSRYLPGVLLWWVCFCRFP